MKALVFFEPMHIVTVNLRFIVARRFQTPTDALCTTVRSSNYVHLNIHLVG